VFAGDKDYLDCFGDSSVPFLNRHGCGVAATKTAPFWETVSLLASIGYEPRRETEADVLRLEGRIPARRAVQDRLETIRGALVAKQ
jgi:hypothetical protein